MYLRTRIPQHPRVYSSSTAAQHGKRQSKKLEVSAAGASAVNLERTVDATAAGTFAMIDNTAFKLTSMKTYEESVDSSSEQS